MLKATSAPKFPLRECQVCNKKGAVCNGEVMVFPTPYAREIFIRCAPIELSGTSREQAEKFYTCLPRLLEQNGAKMSDVVLERVFFRDIAADYALFRQVRQQAYGHAGVTGKELPAASYIEQPPCRPVQAFELQVYAVAARREGLVRIHSFPPTEQNATRKIVEIGGYRHLYVMNINGLGSNGKAPATFRAQSDTMFQRGAALLREHGTEFTKVLRTWCYLDDIDRDYAAFNESRNEFFQHENVQRLPASTGIRSGLFPRSALCSFDLYALLNPEGAQIEVMHTPTLNEANEYGSSFSRGMKLVLPDKTVLFISGTASVDERGATVHINDVRKQVERMLLNVRELLRPHGASFADVAQVITYLKRREYLEEFLQIWDDWGLTGLPNTFVEAGVCRPELLCELEAIAILPGKAQL